MRLRSQKGFTIIELLIATTVFSVVLLIASVGIIAIGRDYYKSLTSTKVQETARSVADDISKSLQFSLADTVSKQLTNLDGTPATVKTRCFGSDRYRYILNQKVQQVTDPSHPADFHALYRDKRPSETTCDSSGNWTDGTELLGENMRLLQFEVSDSDPFQVKIRLLYGDDDLISITQCHGSIVDGLCYNPTDEDIATARCRFNIAGNQFCAASGLETTVTSRVK
ncbi:MAG TPA: prepilin-type N-terminal cleavage/methylation domain-containing protein [Candidatus Saccharimonadales bacterium]|nr:prepilin-type N-terminal cleavage/methylation domain-containing protein [Candidatus Saccharimonadales bacterium]